MKSDLNKSLKKYFGFDNFRKGQKEIVESLLSGNDTLAVMPTGGGKSLCYQLPALLLPGTAIVVSPLIALMKDQTDSLALAGLPAAQLNSSLDRTVISDIMSRTLKGEFKMLFISPERLESKYFIDFLKSVKVSFIAVDEAHCISEWGHDFRPAYMSIVKSLSQIDFSNVIALTATATPEVQDDIVTVLKMKQANVFVTGFDRENLNYSTITTDKKIQLIFDKINKTKSGSSIIYCGSRKRVEDYSIELRKSGIAVDIYHGGLDAEYRKAVQNRFISGESKIIAATNAFGMGIDKSDVRNVIHCDLTSTIEAYYQEAGRAGRDGIPADCTMLFHPNDISLQEFFIRCTYPDLKDMESFYNILHRLAKGNKSVYIDNGKLSELTGIPMKGIESIAEIFHRNSVISKSSFCGTGKLRILATRERMAEYYDNTNDIRRNTVEAVLRSVSSEVFYKTVDLDLTKIRKLHGVSENEFEEAVRGMQYAGLIRFYPSNTSGGYTLLDEKMPLEQLPIDLNAFLNRRKRADKKLTEVIKYAETNDCKRNFILSYFKEEPKGKCGRCSSCLNTKPAKNKKQPIKHNLAEIIVKAVHEIDLAVSREELAAFLKNGRLPNKASISMNQSAFRACMSDIEIFEINQLIQYCENRRYILKKTMFAGGGYKLTDAGRLLAGIKVLNETLDVNKELESVLLTRLKDIRISIAEKEGIKERAVATDVVLKKIAADFPLDKKALKLVKGIGYYLLDKYADLVVSAAVDLRNSNLVSNSKTYSKDLLSIIHAFAQGKSIDEVSDELKMEKGTIAASIQKALESGKELNRRDFVNDDIYRVVVDHLYENPNIVLKDLRSKISIETDFALLRIALIFARKQLNLI